MANGIGREIGVDASSRTNREEFEMIMECLRSSGYAVRLKPGYRRR